MKISVNIKSCMFTTNCTQYPRIGAPVKNLLKRLLKNNWNEDTNQAALYVHWFEKLVLMSRRQRDKTIKLILETEIRARKTDFVFDVEKAFRDATRKLDKYEENTCK